MSIELVKSKILLRLRTKGQIKKCREEPDMQ